MPAVEQELSSVSRLFAEQADLQAVLAQPRRPAAAKRAVVADLGRARRRSTPVGEAAAAARRARSARRCCRMLDVYRERLMEHQQDRAQAEVTTAAPLSPRAGSALQQRLAHATGQHGAR